jgi:hypothetical protein
MPEEILKYKTIAVVGCSTDPKKPAHYIPKYLMEQGYKIIPVNPFAKEILGEKVHPSLLDIPDEVDVVLAFRPSTEAPTIVAHAIKKGARAVWLQEGIVSHRAEKMAKEAGIGFVMDKCMMKEHKKLKEL